MSEQEKVPQDKGLDHTLKLKKEGYRFIPNRMAQLNTDIFVTHLMMKKVICITGQDAVELFYDDHKFTRKKAAPSYVKKTLFGDKTVHGMEGDAHTHRKELFLSIFDDDAQNALLKQYEEYLDQAIPVWEFHEPVTLYNEIKKALTYSVCLWAGVPIGLDELEVKSTQLMALVFGFGNVGSLHEEGKTARKVLEDWMEKIVRDVRTGFLQVEETRAIQKLCEYKELNGEILDNHLAAVEMLNVIRPVVASSIYITFAALALHDYPEYKRKLIDSGEEYCYQFCQEVRRFYPLAPFLGAVIKEDFEWKGCEFKKDGLVLLDVYGTNHSKEIWDNPEEFDPANFKNGAKDAEKLVSQGNGNQKKGHRCPGEEMTVKLMMASVTFLTKTIMYQLVKGQDLSYDLSKVPTKPESGIKIHDICRRPH